MLWAPQSCSPHCDPRYSCFGLVRKVFSTPFPYNQSSSIKWDKLDSHNNFYFFYDWAPYSCSIDIHDIDALVWQEKLFLSPVFLRIKVHLLNRTNLDSRNNLYFFVIGHFTFSSLGTRYWCFSLARKAFLSTIFLIIKVYPSNKINLDSRNNLHSFCYWHSRYVHLIRIHDIDALIWQEKLLFPPFYL